MYQLLIDYLFCQVSCRFIWFFGKRALHEIKFTINVNQVHKNLLMKGMSQVNFSNIRMNGGISMPPFSFLP